MDVDKKTGEVSPTCPKCAHGGNVDLFPDKRMCMACGHVYPKQYLSDMESMKEGNLMDNQKRITPTDAGLISQNKQDNYTKLAHDYSQLEAKLSNAQAENRKLSNIVSVLNYGMQTMVFTPNELAGHECLAKHKLLSLYDYWRKKVAPMMSALVNGNENAQIEKLETDLADKDKQLADAKTEIERLKNEHEDSLRRAKDNAVALSGTVTEYAGELLAKNKIIEQMREALKAMLRYPMLPIELDEIAKAALAAERGE